MKQVKCHKFISCKGFATAMLAFFIAFVFCLFTADYSNVYAEETQDHTVLEVYYQKTPDSTPKLLHEFTENDLKNLAAEEGDQSYTFSGFNTFPTASIIKNVKGPTVRKILNTALHYNTIDHPDVDTVEGIANNHTIEFKAYDGVSEIFTKTQLFNEARYYYPNIANESGRCGQPVQEESFGSVKDKDGNTVEPTQVPAIISLSENESDNVGRLLFGQTVPNEQNQAEFVKYMTGKLVSIEMDEGEEEVYFPGKITIRAWEADKWNPVTSVATRMNENLTEVETALPIGGITLGRDANEFHKNGTPRYWIFYTTDGSEPTNRSNVYNYNNYGFGGLYEGINKPVLLQAGDTVTLKIKVWGYGMLDSDVTTMTFTAKDIAAPQMKSAARAGYASINLSWSKVADVAGYKIYRSAKNQNNYTLLKTVRGDGVTTFKDTNCVTGTRYYYKVKAFTTYCDPGSDSEITLLSPYSNSKYAAATLAKPVISKLTPGKKKNTVRWNKVAGASGYVIYRSTKKSSGYKAIKTIKSGSTVKYINKNLKAKKRYYYKIKAYRNVTSGKSYSVFSAVKSARTK